LKRLQQPLSTAPIKKFEQKQCYALTTKLYNRGRCQYTFKLSLENFCIIKLRCTKFRENFSSDTNVVKIWNFTVWDVWETSTRNRM